MSHEIILCASPTCGAVVMQCRCPSPEKTKTRGNRLCDDCMKRKIAQSEVDYGNNAFGVKGRL